MIFVCFNKLLVILNVLTAQCNVVQKRRRVIPLGGVNFIIFFHHFSLFWCPLHVFEPYCMIFVRFNKKCMIFVCFNLRYTIIELARVIYLVGEE